MKIKSRLTAHFIIGLLLWILSMGLTIMITIEAIFPMLGITESNNGYDLFVLTAFLFNIALCSIFFAWYFGSPLWYIVSWIQQLAEGTYEAPSSKTSIYTKKGRFRNPYRLYKEVIMNIYSLSEHLKKAEQERAKLEEAKKDWMAGISHDLKTPLTYITGYSALLLNDEYKWTEEERISFVEEIAQKGHHMETLIQDLSLAFQMNNIQSLLPVNVSKQNIVEFVKGTIVDIGNDPRADQHHLSFYSNETVIDIDFDERLLYRVLQNLLMNAILHNPHGTNIQVSVTIETEQFIAITISDDGVGMDQDTVDNLFNKYYRGTTTHSNALGTGLGMAIVKNLILAHRGHINVESKISSGTTVQILLPF